VVPVNGEVGYAVVVVEAENKNVIALEAQSLAGQPHKLFSLRTEYNHLTSDAVAFYGHGIYGVVNVGEAVHEQAPDGFAKLSEKPFAVVAEGFKPHGGVGRGEAGHALGVHVLVGREKLNASALAGEVGYGFGCFGSFHVSVTDGPPVGVNTGLG
jgi:hypothetical protein